MPKPEIDYGYFSGRGKQQVACFVCDTQHQLAGSVSIDDHDILHILPLCERCFAARDTEAVLRKFAFFNERDANGKAIN
jgi:hypothetical protein